MTETLLAFYEPSYDDHAIAVDVENPEQAVWANPMADLPADVELLPLARAIEIADQLPPASYEMAYLPLREEVVRCQTRACACSRNARRRAARAFASQVADRVDAHAWVRADVPLPNGDIHFTRDLVTAAVEGPSDGRTAWRHDPESGLVQVVAAGQVRTWRPLDEHRADLRYLWSTPDEFAMVLSWSPELAATVVALWWNSAGWNRRDVPGGLAAYAKLLAPLGGDADRLAHVRALLADNDDPQALVDAVAAATL